MRIVWMRWRAECNIQGSGNIKSVCGMCLNAMKSGVQRFRCFLIYARHNVWMRWRAECNVITLRVYRYILAVFECDEERSATEVRGCIADFRFEFECDEERSATISLLPLAYPYLYVWMRWRAECNIWNFTSERRNRSVWMRWRAECNSVSFPYSLNSFHGLNAMKSGVQHLSGLSWVILYFLKFECDEERSVFLNVEN